MLGTDLHYPGPNLSESWSVGKSYTIIITIIPIPSWNAKPQATELLIHTHPQVHEKERNISWCTMQCRVRQAAFVRDEWDHVAARSHPWPQPDSLLNHLDKSASNLDQPTLHKMLNCSPRRCSWDSDESHDNNHVRQRLVAANKRGQQHRVFMDCAQSENKYNKSNFEKLLFYFSLIIEAGNLNDSKLLLAQSQP